MGSGDARAAKALPDHNTLRAPHKKRVPAVDSLFFLHLDNRNPHHPHLTHPVYTPTPNSHPPPNSQTFFDMPPKAAQKTPTTGGKAPAGKAPAEKKEAGKKTAAPSGDKKKRTKSRKETYSSYIYKGEFFAQSRVFCAFAFSILTRRSPQAGPPRHWYLQPCHVDPELVRQRHLRARCRRGLQACCLQQEVHHLITRDPDLVRHLRPFAPIPITDLFTASD